MGAQISAGPQRFWVPERATLLKLACIFTKINTPQWVLFTFFKLYKCYQIAQRITYLLLFKILLDFNPHIMVKHNLKILQHLLQGFQRVFDDFVGARRYTIQRSLNERIIFRVKLFWVINFSFKDSFFPFCFCLKYNLFRYLIFQM